MARRLPALLALLLLLACPGPDTTPPAVTILTPADQDTARGTITVQARATDNDSVIVVRLFVDAEPRSDDSVPDGRVFEFSLNTTGLAPGSTHTLTCVAFDPAGNQGNSAPVTVFVAGGTRHSGTVNADQTWYPQDNPHVVAGNLTVRARLELQPGVQVQFEPDAAITVGTSSQAALQAQGTESSPVLFTASALQPEPGAWQSVDFLPDAQGDSNLLRYCVFEYGGSSGAMVCSEQAGVAIEHSVLRRSGGTGVRSTGLGLCSFAANRVDSCLGFPVLAAPSDIPAVTGNSFFGNTPDGIAVSGGAVTASGTWQYQAVPYYVTGDIDVGGPATPVLTIDAGCSLLFADSAGLRIGASQPAGFVCDGSASTITFSAYSSAPGPPAWPGIEFWNLTDSSVSILRNCRIADAGANGVAAVVLYGAAAIAGTRIERSVTAGVRAINAGFTQFTDNTVTGCASFPVRLGAPFVGTMGSGNQLTGNDRDTIEVAGGDISVNSQWRNHGIPYLVKDRVRFGASRFPLPTLIIDPGAVLVFEPGASLVVGQTYPGGTIFAVGRPDSILFTATRPEPGAWFGVRIYGFTANSILDHCRLLYGGADPELGILYLDSCAPVITSNEIAFSAGYCISLRESPLDEDSLREQNWLHHWDTAYADIGDIGLD